MNMTLVPHNLKALIKSRINPSHLISLKQDFHSTTNFKSLVVVVYLSLEILTPISYISKFEELLIMLTFVIFTTIRRKSATELTQ